MNYAINYSVNERFKPENKLRINVIKSGAIHGRVMNNKDKSWE